MQSFRNAVSNTLNQVPGTQPQGQQQQQQHYNAPPQYGQAPPPQQQQYQQPPQQQQPQYPVKAHDQAPYGQPQAQPLGQPQAGANQPPLQSDWSTGLCGCFSDCGSCLEVYFCSCFQASAQWNRLKNGQKGVDPLACGAILLAELLTGCGTCIVTFLLRKEIRLRYNIKGDDCGDCCVAFWCSCCALTQNYREMCVRGEHPGGLCTTSTPYVMN